MMLTDAEPINNNNQVFVLEKVLNNDYRLSIFCETQNSTLIYQF